MKKVLYIITCVLEGLMLAGCIVDRTEHTPSGTRAVLDIEVLTDGAIEDDHLHKARFITFDNASFSPRIDINQLVPFDAADRDATVFGTRLRVSANEDKMLLVIINEPDELTAHLNGVKTLGELADLDFQMASVFNANHTAPAASGLPMTGAVRNISVGKANTESNPAKAKVMVYRSVARVELWLRTAPGVNASVNASTSVKLSGSTDRGLLMKSDPDYGFGRIQTVAVPDRTVSWTFAGAVPQDLDTTAQLVCAFYTPERTCSAPGNADKLILEIEGVSTSQGIRGTQVVLSDFSTGGGPSQTLRVIERNNVYRLTGRLQDNAIRFEHTIIPWAEMAESVIIDPQYYLRVSSDNVDLPAPVGVTVSITAETNYNRSDRDFPAGIVIGRTVYYDAADNEVERGLMAGWLKTEVSGADGSLTREILFWARNSLTVESAGCYAKVEVKAGNAVKLVRVNPLIININ